MSYTYNAEIPYNAEKIRRAYKSKYNKEHGNQVTLLMFTDGRKCHYLAVKNYLHYLER